MRLYNNKKGVRISKDNREYKQSLYSPQRQCHGNAWAFRDFLTK